MIRDVDIPGNTIIYYKILKNMRVRAIKLPMEQYRRTLHLEHRSKLKSKSNLTQRQLPHLILSCWVESSGKHFLSIC